jgi:hypothetical protein
VEDIRHYANAILNRGKAKDDGEDEGNG